MPVIQPAGSPRIQGESPRKKPLLVTWGSFLILKDDPLQAPSLRPQFKRTEDSFGLYAHG